MKKFATLSLAAVAVLTLSACGGEGAANNVTIDNEMVLNSEEPIDNLVVDNAMMDNAVMDNAVVDNAAAANVTE